MKNMKNKKNKTFVCCNCGKEYEESWTTEEAEKEAEELWGVKNASEAIGFDVICDDCFNVRTSEERKKMGDEFKEEMNLKKK